VDAETLEKLISGQPKEVRSRAILLFNGAADCAKAYKNTPTAATLRDYEASQMALAKYAEQISAKDASERPFTTIADVLDYLKNDGWRVTKTSLYRHQKEGKLLPRPDGTYHPKDVEKYARTWLKQQSTGKRVNEKMDELQRKKLEMELDGLELQKKRNQLSYERDLGRFVRREDMEIELATRAGILDAGLKHWVKSHAAEWIRVVDGNMQKIGELISQMNRELDEHINSYATSTEYDVVIDAEEEVGTEGMDMETGEELIIEEAAT
jgi:hypothetical protein